MDSLASHVITGVISLAVGMALIWLSPRAKLVWWNPHQFTFQIQAPVVQAPAQETASAAVPVPAPAFYWLYTHAITIQNVGRLRPAVGVEIVHSRSPDIFQLYPPREYEVRSTPQGDHIVRIATLGPREWVNIEFLSYTAIPGAPVIRSDAGAAQNIMVQFNRVLPRWTFWLGWLLIFSGGGFWAYWLIRVAKLVIRAQ